MHIAVSAADAMGGAVEHEIADLERVGDEIGPGTAQHRMDAGHQFGNREGLDDVVVGAGGEAAHALALPRRER